MFESGALTYILCDQVPELYPSLCPMQRVYLRGRKLGCWACSLEPKPCLSLNNSSRRFMWIGFSRLLIMTARGRDTPARVAPGEECVDLSLDSR